MQVVSEGQSTGQSPSWETSAMTSLWAMGALPEGSPMEGAFRRVYRLGGRLHSAVAKLEATSQLLFHNVREWQLWQDLKHTPFLNQWLAPCLQISADGSALIMARTEPLADWPDGERQLLPSIFSDVKLANFGTIGGRLVCHDYANNLVSTRASHAYCMVPYRDLPGDHDHDYDAEWDPDSAFAKLRAIAA